ncbi:hypothetical protein WJX79_004037 [Trebouxia sp. C0005]
MGVDFLKVECWPETLSNPTACTLKVSKDVLWEDLLDYDEDEAEEDFLQQYIALLMIPNMQYDSLEALSAPGNDLLILTGTGLWDPLQKGLIWLARAKIAKVLPDCLTGSKLLHQALGTVLLAARGQLATSADTLLLGVHVVTGALSLSHVRKLFPIDMSAKQVSLEGALQAVITVFSSLPPLPNTTTPPPLATSNGQADLEPAIQTRLPAVPSEVRVAALQALQSLALQHSSKGGGKNGVAERQTRPTVGKLPGITDVDVDRMAVEMHKQLCEIVRDSWDIVAQLCLTSAGNEMVMQAQVQSRQCDSLNAADVAASLLLCLPSAVSGHPADTSDEAPSAVVRSALGPILRAVQALVQTSAGYEAVDAAGVPNMLIHHLNHASASKMAADANDCDMSITACILSMCSQPLLSLRLSQSPAALQCCAGRLAAQAQHEDETSWLYQASSLALTEAGQKALLHAGLPQQLLHLLYRLPMQSTDHDTDAMREQQHAKLLHACEVVMSWDGLAEHLLPANVGQQIQLAYHSILQDLCQAGLQASPCPLSSSADCPILSTLEGAEAALRLLTAACIPLRCRWVLNSHLNLRNRLQQHLDTQEKEAGVAIIDMTSALRQQLLNMLQTKQGLTSRASLATQAASPAQPQPHVPQSFGTASLHGRPGLSLSELSVLDPGMKDPQAWLLTVQKALLVSIEQGQLQWKALPLILQRAVMVAMKASSQEGLSPATQSLQAYCHQEDQPRMSNSAAGSKLAAQCPPTSACQPELEAFVTQAKQQMPSLAGRLTALQLQDFLCSMRGPHQSAMPSSSSSASSIQMVDYFASIVWLIMRGDAVATEFLAALTDSQAAIYLWPDWGHHESEPATQLSAALVAQYTCNLLLQQILEYHQQAFRP